MLFEAAADMHEFMYRIIILIYNEMAAWHTDQANGDDIQINQAYAHTFDG